MIERMLFLALISAPALASSGHGEINWWHLGSAYSEAPALGWLFITFFIFVFGLIYAIKKPLSLYLETRSKDIRKQIEEGKEAKLESEKKLRLYEEKLNSLDREIDRLKNNFEEQAKAEQLERERLLKELEGRIAHEADDTIKASYERAKNNLAEEVVEKALKIASATIASSRLTEVDGILKRAFIEDLNSAETKLDPKHIGATGSNKPLFNQFKASAEEGVH